MCAVPPDNLLSLIRQTFADVTVVDRTVLQSLPPDYHYHLLD